jgi:hypothetical protein
VSDMTEAEFEAKFKPIEGPSGESGTYAWERKEVDAALAAGTIAERQVWTVVDDGDAECASAGWAFVNRMHHMVTEVPWVTELECAVLMRYCTHCGAYMELDASGSWVPMGDEPCEEKANGQHEVDA